MSQSAKAQEPSMEEILASIRRIIADDETSKPQPKAPPPAPQPRPVAAPPRPQAPPPPPPPAPSMNQNDVDAMLAGLDAPPGGERPDADQQDILELTESMQAPPANIPSFQTIDGQPDVVFTDAPVHADPPPRVTEEPRRSLAHNAHNRDADPSLLSSATAAAVDSAFNALAQTVLIQNARTLEDLVREMLRPMLKSWLDDNLPGLVERIVKAEIERVSRGRG
jgi:cell pole-organizing protein PopZ